jgi:ribose transport system permease protein
MSNTTTAAETVHAKPRERMPLGERLGSLLLRQETTLIAVIVLVGALATLRNADFLTTDNLTEVGRSTVIYFVMACGAGLLMIGGGLDFSVGSVFTLGGLATAWLLTHDVAWPLAVLLGVGLGVLVGFANNAIVVYLHVPPIIATLGTFFILSGLSVQITGGMDILPLPDAFQKLGQGDVAGVPNVVLYGIAVGLLFWFMLEQTRFGVNVRALGGNRQAAVGNGLRVGRLDFALYALASATAAFAGIIYTARVGSGQVGAGGATTTLTVFTAALIGGTSLFGGLGKITGVALGAILLSEIDNALVVASIDPQYNSIIVGTILIVAVAADHLRRNRLYRRR